MPPVLEHAQKVFRVSIYEALFLKIAEPRIIRIMLFFVYLFCFWAGILVISNRPEIFLEIIGPDLVFIFGVLITLGSLLGGIAILPGIWWLERVGIILLFTCVMIYVVIIAYRNATPVAGGFSLGFGIFLAARFIEIRGAQLAPREA
jgi:hypothetical protein